MTLPPLSSIEAQIVGFLYRCEESHGRQILRELLSAKGESFPIATYLNRLERKGVISSTKEARNNVIYRVVKLQQGTREALDRSGGIIGGRRPSRYGFAQLLGNKPTSLPLPKVK